MSTSYRGKQTKVDQIQVDKCKVNIITEVNPELSDNTQQNSRQMFTNTKYTKIINTMLHIRLCG